MPCHEQPGLARLAPVLAAFALLALAQPTSAQTLRFGVGSGPNTVDPHFHNTPANNGTLLHIFEGLAVEDNEGRIVPRLALSWRVVEPTTWEFRLRPDARFQDGTPFTAEDVAFTFRRAAEVPNSPGPFTAHTGPVAAVEVVDAHTVRLRTREPYPFIPRDAAALMMLSARLHEGATTPEFNRGMRAIGTGPYRFAAFTPGESLLLERNPGWWGGTPEWERVELRVIAQEPARAAALLAGDVDLVDDIRGANLARVSADPRVRIARIAGANTMYLFPDGVREQAPFVTDRDGRPPERSPLMDLRVRRALSISIDREAISRRLLEGMAEPAHQMLGPGVEGRDEGLGPIPFDPALARRLLADAGWPEGFGITLHGPIGFYPDDVKLVQGIAQYWNRIGVITRVETLPRGPYFTRATNREFAMFLGRWTGTLGVNTLRSLVATPDRDRGLGSFNRQRYSSPALDAALSRALTMLEDGPRNAAVAEAERIAVEDVALIPLVHSVVTWAMRSDRVAAYDASPLGRNQAMLAWPAR